MELDEITEQVIDAAFKIHSQIGPGLLESAYEKILVTRLRSIGLRVEQQKLITFELDGLKFDAGFRVDVFVENRVIVELKSVEQLSPVHSKQVLTYLRLLNLPVGLLINFGGSTMKGGLHRIINRYQHPSLGPDRLPLPKHS